MSKCLENLAIAQGLASPADILKGASRVPLRDAPLRMSAREATQGLAPRRFEEERNT